MPSRATGVPGGRLRALAWPFVRFPALRTQGFVLWTHSGVMAERRRDAAPSGGAVQRGFSLPARLRLWIACGQRSGGFGEQAQQAFTSVQIGVVEHLLQQP